ncbi:uncharacterized protein [Garra rufa]|uniref:uncharacterized protein n=1 Tax=Garra rufa TaxID=137080 RepID=UPI003CCE831E
MADKCHLCLLGLIFLSSLLTGTSGVDDVHVFISSGENVRLPCNNALANCKSTTWIYMNRHSAAVELISLGIKKKDTERHERLSLGSDCSLNIKNITKEDSGLYICQQWTGVNREQKHGIDARVYLHVLHVSSSSSQTEISPGSSVTLSCQLYSYSYAACDYWIRSEGYQLFWVNQAGDKLTISDSRYQISAPGHCIITLTTTLLNEDDNREWRCNVTHRNQVKTSATYTVKISGKENVINQFLFLLICIDLDSNSHQYLTVTISSSGKVIYVSVSAAAFVVFILAVLWLIWRNKRAGEFDFLLKLRKVLFLQFLMVCFLKGKAENEDKVTYETINMSNSTARDNVNQLNVQHSVHCLFYNVIH